MSDVHRRIRVRSARIFLVGMALFVVLSCSGRNVSDGAAAEGPGVAAVTGLNANQALALANSWKGTAGVTTFVDQQKVSFQFEDGTGIEVPLPLDTMVVAVAPFVNTTHPCQIHYMSGCQGELVDAEMRVVARSVDGTVVTDASMTTMKNGFIELWLPRDREFDLTIEYDGKQATQRITTSAESWTCITTMRLL